MSIPNLRAIRDWCREKFKEIENSLIINGDRVYLDCQNGKYGVNTDPERGADTFTPFKSDEGDGGTESPLNFKYDIIPTSNVYFQIGTKSTAGEFIYFPIKDIKKIKKVVINNLALRYTKYLSSMQVLSSCFFSIYGKKNGQSTYSPIVTYSAVNNNYSVSVSNSELDLDGWDSIDYIQFFVRASTSTSYTDAYYYRIFGGFDIDIYY